MRCRPVAATLQGTLRHETAQLMQASADAVKHLNAGHVDSVQVPFPMCTCAEYFITAAPAAHAPFLAPCFLQTSGRAGSLLYDPPT